LEASVRRKILAVMIYPNDYSQSDRFRPRRSIKRSRGRSRADDTCAGPDHSRARMVLVYQRGRASVLLVCAKLLLGPTRPNGPVVRQMASKARAVSKTRRPAHAIRLAISSSITSVAPPPIASHKSVGFDELLKNRREDF
jgi:hypothetical protein